MGADEMRARRWVFGILSVIWPFLLLLIELFLYKAWFDFDDMIKYDKTFSLEDMPDQTVENVIYWTVFWVGCALEIVFIWKFRARRRPPNNDSQCRK